MLSGHSRVAHLFVDPARLAAVSDCEGHSAAAELRDFFAETDEVMASMVRLVFAHAQGGVIDALAHEEVMAMVLRHLLRHYSFDRPLPKAMPRVTLTASTMRKLFDYIEERLAGELRLAELAALARLSDDHFLRCFKAAVGATAHQYVLARRISRTRELLERSTKPVAEVARAAGFRGASHFLPSSSGMSVWHQRIGGRSADIEFVRVASRPYR